MFTLGLPPLRERPEDLEELIRVLLDELNERHRRSVRGVDEAALAILRRYAWPGNVRELRNVLERAVIVCPGDLIGVAHLPAPPAATTAPAEVRPRTGAPRTCCSRSARPSTRPSAVSSSGRSPTPGNNKTRAAEILGISLKTLHNKLNRYNRSS